MQEKDATIKSFMNKLTAIYEVLCKLLNATSPTTPFTVTGTDCSGAPVTAEATSTVQTIPHPNFIQKVRIECDNKIDPEVVCLSNDGGTTIVKGWEVFDVSTNPPTSTLYIGGAAVTGYSVVPCDKPMQYDYEKERVCVDGLNYTKWYVWDKTGDGLPNLVTVRWLDETDTVVAAPDPLLINNINCKGCKKEIFATHDRFISVPGVPVGFVAYEMTNDLPTQGLDVSNAYFHLIYPTLNGTQNIAYGPQLTDYFANPQLGILWSDIAGVQAVIDFVLPLMNLSVGDVVYAINTTNTPIFLLSPTAVAELANNTYLHIYWGDTDVHSSYNETADVNVIAANPNILLGGANKCVGIQEIKEKDTCTGEETYRYVIEDLNGDLVNVTSIYPDFVEADVLLECPAVSKTVDVPNCAGTLVEKEVDSIVGAYILNQENKHTETVYDIVNAAIGGTITYTYTSPTNIALNLNTVTVTNDSLVGFWTDFGDGYNDFGNVPDHSYNADGSYEIKTYAILNSKNKILINAKEVIITNGVVAYAPTGTSSTINRPYRHVVNTALQNYCGNTPVDNPYLADGTSYTPTGTLGLHLDAIIDELEDNAEWNPENVADLVECVVGSANLVTEALDVNLGAIKEVVNPGSTLTTFHTLLGNNLDIQGDGLTNIMGAGINANISGSTYIGAQFTYTFNLIGEDDPGDPADFGITVWDNVAGTSVTATSITSTATYAGDAQGSGLNVPFYGWGAPGTYTIVWTGDLPVGDYTIGYMNQNFSPADHVELQVTHNLVDSMTTSKAQLVALDQCTIDALTPDPVLREVNFIDCRTIQTAEVESVGAVYVLNNKFESVETVYDIQQSTIIGSITPTISGNRLTIPFAGLTVTNIAPVTGTLAVDFGSGFVNYGGTPDQDFTNQPNGEYESKIYYIAFVDGKVIYLLLGVCEFTVTNGVPTITSTIPINVNRSIDRCIGVAKQQFCEGSPVGDPYDPDGNSYVFQGNKSYKCPELVNEYIPNGNSDNLTQILGLETPNGKSYTNTIVPQNPQPAIVKSITVTRQSGAIVEVSFDNGLTWDFRIIGTGGFTWGQGNSEGLNTAFMRVRQLGNGTFNIHWEI